MKDYRVLGSWILVIMVFLVLMTIGCEKGASGLKTGIVMGRMVDGTKRDVGVAGARVQIASAQPQSSGGGVPLGQQLVTTTDANGNFYFDGVRADAMTLYATHGNYFPFSYPNSNASASGNAGDSGSAPGAAGQNIWVTTNAVVNMGDLSMSPKPTTIPTGDITVKLYLRDAFTRELIDTAKNFPSKAVYLTVDNVQKVPMDPSDLRTTGLSLSPKTATYSISINVDPGSGKPRMYQVYDFSLAGNQSSVTDVYLQPFTYQISCRFLNCPSYITGGNVNVFAEVNDPNNSEIKKIIATQTVDTVTIQGENRLNLPLVVPLPEVPLPVSLRFNVFGYIDEVVDIPVSAGTQGNVRVDVDFMGDNSLDHYYSYNHPDTTKSVNGVKKVATSYPGFSRIVETRSDWKPDQASVMLFDNRLMRPVTAWWAGPHFYGTAVPNAVPPINAPLDRASVQVWDFVKGWSSAVYGSNYSLNFDYAGNSDPTNNFLIPIGYELNSWLTVIHGAGTPGAASGSYTVGPNKVTIPPDAVGIPLSYIDYWWHETVNGVEVYNWDLIKSANFPNRHAPVYFVAKNPNSQ
ncbi:MAG: carboxypeptidase regulatory-like domain-containing protein [Candidatus Riflebacteria bacterium]|nr:carboxypeptidase regulatory-like domain-containing protein [Candidatus Riflebacteria bacterium]